MAEDFRVRVIAETQEAEKKLQQVDAAADKAVKPRNIKIEFPSYAGIRSNFTTLQKDIKNASNDIKQFYQVASKLPVGPLAEINEAVGNVQALGKAANESKKSFGDAGAVIRGTLESTGRAAENLVARLTRIAFALYAINEAAKIAQSAFSGLFSETIGREIQLRETILKAQTTLASTNKVFTDGKEITDPYEKIVALTGAVSERIDSIRERSIALAGVTSNEVIEVFGIVASQVGQIGGGLKEAEDLAINFAAALGTFGIPLYQAQQEIGSILRGDITTDSYLARALGITNEDVARAKSQAGGVVKFLEDRLAAAVAGQRIAAEGFAGVVSNIKDLSELINQNFGRGLLDPLIDGLTKVFNFLFNIRKELFSIASVAGSSLGKLLSIGFGRTLGASGGFRRTEGGGGGAGSRGTTAARSEARVVSTTATQVLTNVENLIKRVTVEINKALSTVYLQLATLTERAANAFGALVKGLTALGLGLLSLQIENIKALVGAAEAVSPALLLATKAASGFLAVWGSFLQLPVVQELAQIRANMRLLEISGIMPLIKTGFVLKGVIENWAKVSEFVVTQFNRIRAIIGGLIVYLGRLTVAASQVGTGFLAAWRPTNAALVALRAELEGVVAQLNKVGTAAQTAGAKIGSLNTTTKTATGGIVGLIAGFIKFQLLMFAISAILSAVLERFSAWKEGQDKIASDKRAEEALNRLRTTYKDIGESADEATKRAAAFEQSLVDAKYDEALQNLEDIRKKIEEIRGLASDDQSGLSAFARRIAQIFNPANFDVKQLPGETFAQAVLRKRLEDEKKAEADKAKWASEINKQEAERNLQLEAQNRVNLEREIGDLKRQLDNDLFQQRQALAQKEVEIFRAAGELRIQQIERANAKLLEGEEGASRAALEALDNYISTKERGELEIAAAQKTIAIEVGNLEKAISDYRYDIEKKIADLRKKSADYEKNAADARARAGQAPGVTAGFRVGSTGRSTGPHLDIRSPTGDKQAVVNEALAIIKHWQGQGVEYIELSNAKIDVKNMVDEAALRGALLKEQAAHAKRSGGGAIDIAVPAGTLVPMPVGTPSWGGAGGWQATSLQTGNLFLHGLDTSVASPAAGAARPAAAATTGAASELPDAADAAARYAEAVRSVAGAMERLRSLQAAITEAKTAEAFERIAKAAFPQAAVEQYQDQLAQLQFTYNAVSTNAKAAFDPERTRLEAERLAQIAISNRELNEIKAGIAKRENLSESDRKRAMDSVLQQHKQYLADIERIDKLKRDILATEQITTFIQQSAVRTRDIEREIEALQLRNRLQAEGSAPEIIEAELAKLEIQREMNRQLELANGDLAKQANIRAAAVKQAAAVDALARKQTEPGVRIKSFIGEAERSLKDYEGMAIQVSQSVGDAVGNSLANGITGLIEGTTTIKDIFAQFLKDIGRILIQQATAMIATYVAIGIAKMFAFGGSGSSGGGGSTNIDVSGFQQYPILPSPRAMGGPVMASRPYLVGERGPELFVPGVGGSIVSAEATRSALADNRSFLASSYIGETSQSEDGTASDVATAATRASLRETERLRENRMQIMNQQSASERRYERERIEQMASTPGNLNIKYESQVINNVEYVTRDQAERMAAQSALRGRELAIGALQNSVKTRKRVGI